MNKDRRTHLTIQLTDLEARALLSCVMIGADHHDLALRGPEFRKAAVRVGDKVARAHKQFEQEEKS